MKNLLKENIPFATWLIALIGMLGSLYFSEIRGFPPCVLCWYQRIALYPLVFFMPWGIFKNDKNLPRYVLSLTIPGMVVAFYHNLLYYKIIPENLAPCVNGISCTTKYISYFGFITIPLMSLAALTLITGLMVAYWYLMRQDQSDVQ